MITFKVNEISATVDENEIALRAQRMLFALIARDLPQESAAYCRGQLNGIRAFLGAAGLELTYSVRVVSKGEARQEKEKAMAAIRFDGNGEDHSDGDTKKRVALY